MVARLAPDYRYVLSDVAGNNERLAFVYDSQKLARLEMTGEIAVPPSQHRWIKLPFTEQKFTGFDRNPYLATFGTGRTSFAVVNVHLYYGSDSTKAKNRRALETFDFDQVLFADLWNDPARTEADFKAFMRYYISHHRPMWMEFAAV